VIEDFNKKLNLDVVWQKVSCCFEPVTTLFFFASFVAFAWNDPNKLQNDYIPAVF